MWLTILGLLFITLIPASTAIVSRFPAEKLATACFSANSFLQALTSWVFWTYVVRNREQLASHSDPRLLCITAQVWLVITIGWLVSILLGFISVFLAYASWILWPNLVAVWGNYRRRAILSSPSREVRRHDKKKVKKQETPAEEISAI